jgi:quercetin dioxygenase-like cupin family protein
MRLVVFLFTAGLVLAQQPAFVTANQAEGKWEHHGKDASGIESMTLREDEASGATELIAHYPAGHEFAPHWHDSNERVVILEGALRIRSGGKETMLEPGGYAYFPAKQVHGMTCVSKSSRCAFYVAWDGKIASHRVEGK